jgi:hypothetical protein
MPKFQKFNIYWYLDTLFMMATGQTEYCIIVESQRRQTKASVPCYEIPPGSQPHRDVNGYYIRKGGKKYFIPTDLEAMTKYLELASLS